MPPSLRVQRLTSIDSCFTARPDLTCSRRYASSGRRIHTSGPDKAASAALSADASASSPPLASLGAKAAPALACLPLSQVLRTWAITTVSSSPFLLDRASAILRRMLASKSFLTNVDRNPVVRSLLYQTFYKQFCAGETSTEVRKTCQELRSTGYEGVILEYALEVLKDAEGLEAQDVEVWRKGMLETVDMAAPGDFVGLKWSGMGPAALKRTLASSPPSPLMLLAMEEVCSLAASKSIALLPAAEETTTLDAIHAWSLAMQKKYNVNGKVVVYNTYQAYLKRTANDVSKHLAEAKAQGFTLGLKLVRGAYLAAEPKHLLQPSVEATHANYDAITEALIQREYRNVLQPLHGTGSEAFPEIEVVLASHNAETVRKAQMLRTEQAQAGRERTKLVYAQLQGMADEVSCSLISAANAAKTEGEKGVDAPKVFKCTTWGSMSECLNYLLRRAAENKDAAGRTAESRKAMAKELGRRAKGIVGLA